MDDASCEIFKFMLTSSAVDVFLTNLKKYFKFNSKIMIMTF